jgi:hypothetical protein
VSGLWPWWLGATGLAAVTVGSCLAGRRPFGVSGIVGRFVNLREELAAERSRAALEAAGDAALEAALAAATAEAFGELMPAGEPAGSGAPAPGAAAAAAPEATGGEARPCSDCAAPSTRPTLGAHAVFLLAIVAGGFLASLLRGGFQPSLALPEAYARLVAPGGLGLLVLALGGLLVGVGTAVSGGCSTGHGLSGCARLQPAGLAATATFFTVAVGVSLWLGGRLP